MIYPRRLFLRFGVAEGSLDSFPSFRAHADFIFMVL